MIDAAVDCGAELEWYQADAEALPCPAPTSSFALDDEELVELARRYDCGGDGATAGDWEYLLFTARKRA